MIRPLAREDLILETERLILAPLVMEDMALAKALLCDSRVMHFVDDPMTPEAVEDHMYDAVKRAAGGRIGIWSIARKDTGEKVGDAVLMPVPIETSAYDWSTMTLDAYPVADIEVGYLFVPGAWGQGFATEACRRLLRFAFEQTELTEVVATVDPDHHRSQNVLGKAGLCRVGLRRAYGFDDVLWMKITRDMWGSVSVLS